MAVVISTQQLESSLLEIDEYANAEIEKLIKDRDFADICNCRKDG